MESKLSSKLPATSLPASLMSWALPMVAIGGVLPYLLGMFGKGKSRMSLSTQVVHRLLTLLVEKLTEVEGDRDKLKIKADRCDSALERAKDLAEANEKIQDELNSASVTASNLASRNAELESQLRELRARVDKKPRKTAAPPS